MLNAYMTDMMCIIKVYAFPPSLSLNRCCVCDHFLEKWVVNDDFFWCHPPKGQI